MSAREKSRLCTAALCILFALVVLRDIGLSRKLAGLFDKRARYQADVDQLSSEIDRFFGGAR